MPPVNNILNLGQPYPGFYRWTAGALTMLNLLGLRPSAGGSRDPQGSDIAPSGAGAHSFHADTLA